MGRAAWEPCGVQFPWSLPEPSDLLIFYLVIVYLLSFIRCTEHQKGVCFMEDKISYMVDKDEISQQKMRLIVINRRPQYLQKSQEVAKREIERQLFQIFQKYV